MKAGVGQRSLQVVTPNGGLIEWAVDIVFDDKAGVFILTSTELTGLVVEAQCMEELVAETQLAASSLLLEYSNYLSTHAEFQPKCPQLTTDEVGRMWRDALGDRSLGCSAEEVLSRLEKKYQVLANDRSGAG